MERQDKIVFTAISKIHKIISKIYKCIRDDTRVPNVCLRTLFNYVDVAHAINACNNNDKVIYKKVIGEELKILRKRVSANYKKGGDWNLILRSAIDEYREYKKEEGLRKEEELKNNGLLKKDDLSKNIKSKEELHFENLYKNMMADKEVYDEDSGEDVKAVDDFENEQLSGDNTDYYEGDDIESEESSMFEPEDNTTDECKTEFVSESKKLKQDLVNMKNILYKCAENEDDLEYAEEQPLMKSEKEMNFNKKANRICKEKNLKTKSTNKAKNDHKIKKFSSKKLVKPPKTLNLNKSSFVKSKNGKLNKSQNGNEFTDLKGNGILQTNNNNHNNADHAHNEIDYAHNQNNSEIDYAHINNNELKYADINNKEENEAEIFLTDTRGISNSFDGSNLNIKKKCTFTYFEVPEEYRNKHEMTNIKKTNESKTTKNMKYSKNKSLSAVKKTSNGEKRVHSEEFNLEEKECFDINKLKNNKGLTIDANTRKIRVKKLKNIQESETNVKGSKYLVDDASKSGNTTKSVVPGDVLKPGTVLSKRRKLTKHPPFDSNNQDLIPISPQGSNKLEQKIYEQVLESSQESYNEEQNFTEDKLIINDTNNETFKSFIKNDHSPINLSIDDQNIGYCIENTVFDNEVHNSGLNKRTISGINTLLDSFSREEKYKNKSELTPQQSINERIQSTFLKKNESSEVVNDYNKDFEHVDESFVFSIDDNKPIEPSDTNINEKDIKCFNTNDYETFNSMTSYDFVKPDSQTKQETIEFTVLHQNSNETQHPVDINSSRVPTSKVEYKNNNKSLYSKASDLKMLHSDSLESFDLTSSKYYIKPDSKVSNEIPDTISSYGFVIPDLNTVKDAIEENNLILSHSQEININQIVNNQNEPDSRLNEIDEQLRNDVKDTEYNKVQDFINTDNDANQIDSNFCEIKGSISNENFDEPDLYVLNENNIIINDTISDYSMPINVPEIQSSSVSNNNSFKNNLNNKNKFITQRKNGNKTISLENKLPSKNTIKNNEELNNSLINYKSNNLIEKEIYYPIEKIIDSSKMLESEKTIKEIPTPSIINKRRTASIKSYQIEDNKTINKKDVSIENKSMKKRTINVEKNANKIYDESKNMQNVRNSSINKILESKNQNDPVNNLNMEKINILKHQEKTKADDNKNVKSSVTKHLIEESGKKRGIMKKLSEKIRNMKKKHLQPKYEQIKDFESKPKDPIKRLADKIKSMMKKKNTNQSDLEKKHDTRESSSDDI